MAGAQLLTAFEGA